MAQQAAHKTKLLTADIISGEQVDQNIVVVAVIQRYFMRGPDSANARMTSIVW